MRSRSEATASRSREAGLIMRHSGTDDVNKRRCSFAIIATIFISSFNCQRLKIIISSRALFNLAGEISLREDLIFSTGIGNSASEEVTAVMVGDALLAVMAKSDRVLPIMARRAR